MQSIRRRITMLCLTMLMLAAAIAVRLAYLISVPNYQETARQQGTYTIRTPTSAANRYHQSNDRSSHCDFALCAGQRRLL